MPFNRKWIVFLIVLGVISVSTACQGMKRIDAPSKYQISLIKLVCVELCEDRNEQPFSEREYTDKTSIETFAKAIRSSSPMKGSLDYGAEFEMHIHDKGQTVRKYHLSLTENKGHDGLLVALSNTQQGYTIPAGDADRLRELIWKTEASDQ